METKPVLSEFIGRELLSDQRAVTSDENLLSDGMIDSLGMLRLVGFIEESFGIQVPPEDLTIDNFRTIDLLDAYLQRALASTDDSRSDA